MNPIMTYDQIYMDRWAPIQSYFTLPETVEHQMPTKVGFNWGTISKLMILIQVIAMPSTVISVSGVLWFWRGFSPELMDIEWQIK